MTNLIAVCAAYYWEQDVQFKFTLLQKTAVRSLLSADFLSEAIGKAAWDISDLAPHSFSWSHMEDIFQRRLPFNEVEWVWHSAGEMPHFLSVSGEPSYDGDGTFIGYRGVMRDITPQLRRVENLRRFRMAMEASGDPITMVDRPTMRYIDFNDIVCKKSGYTREELLTMGPLDLLEDKSHAELEQEYDAVIAASPRGVTIESYAINKAGESYLYEMHRRAFCFEGRWVIVSTARDITARKQAEERAVRMGQMYAATSSANEAILHAKNPEDLYQKVCEAAIESGAIISAAVLLAVPGSEWAQIAAHAGAGAETLRSARISFADDKPEGRGMVGTSFRSQKVCIINDFHDDARMRTWAKHTHKEQAASGAAFALIRNNQSTGVLLLYSNAKHGFNDEIVQLFERMARNIAFALDNFDRERERLNAVIALQASEQKYRTTLENIEDAFYEVDLAGNLRDCNDALCRMFECQRAAIIGTHYTINIVPVDYQYVFSMFNEVFRTGIPKNGVDWKVRSNKGETLFMEGSINVVTDMTGQVTGFRGMLRDVTARRTMETALRASEERFRALTELSSDWYWEQDGVLQFLHVNGDVLAKTGIPADTFLGHALWELPFEETFPGQWHQLQRLQKDGRAFSEMTWRVKTQEGMVRYVSISGVPIFTPDGALTGYRGIGKDVTDRKEHEQRIEHLASHDMLTGLPNRMMFTQMLTQSVQQARRYDRHFALMFIDLDHFKAVNDTFGHAAGDALLRETARRLSDNVRASDVVARLSGDEFVVIIQEPGSRAQLEAIAQKILTAFRSPISLGGNTHIVTASVGISSYPADGQDEEALLRHADAAMYRVKHSTKNSFHFHLPQNPVLQTAS
jgi:diguanylate cyclase (GGDEF)-like protein/PAS domain S-box-containing protein